MSVAFESLVDEFERTYSRRPEIVAEAPGRVNLIGEHTDYNAGLVLPAAIDRTVGVAAAAREDGLVRVKSLDYDQCDEFRVEGVRRFPGSRGWRDYVRGVYWALQDEHLELRGADLVFTGDIPQGAGLSSSAALEVAVAAAAARVSSVEVDAVKLARLCQRAENLFVGVNCGIMDQMASALGVEGHALLIDCRDLRWEAVSLPGSLAILIIDSGVSRNLAATGYNRRREECAEAAAELGVELLRDVTRGMLDAASRTLPNPLLRRTRHVITENERVKAMVEALRLDDGEAIGRLMGESHESLRGDFEVSTPEIDGLVAIAREAGAIGARMTGAGFGGCTVNLIERDAAEDFGEAVVSGYERSTALKATEYRCRATSGVRVSEV